MRGRRGGRRREELRSSGAPGAAGQSPAGPASYLICIPYIHEPVGSAARRAGHRRSTAAACRPPRQGTRGAASGPVTLSCIKQNTCLTQVFKYFENNHPLNWVLSIGQNCIHCIPQFQDFSTANICFWPNSANS